MVRPRTPLVKSRQNLRCPKCNAKIDRQRKRCKRCAKVQPKN
jgi:predicted amidophosphoribosyltransferase